MGLTRVKVVVKSLETGASREVELVVDAGSTFTWIDRRVLEELGVKPRRVRWFKTRWTRSQGSSNTLDT